MQVAYSKKNLKLNYLNCYTKFILDNDYLFFNNLVFDKKIVLNGDNANLKELLNALTRGVDYNNLIIILSKIHDKPEDLYECLLQNYIVE